MKKRTWDKKGKRGNRGCRKGQLVLFLIIAAVCVVLCKKLLTDKQVEIGSEEAIEVSTDGNFIKWVDFNVTCEAMGKAYELDVASYKDEVHVDWIELLAYVGAKHGGQFDKSCVSELQETADKLQEKETTIAKLTKDMEYYDYYEEAYRAVLGGMVGEFSLEVPVESDEDSTAEQSSETGESVQSGNHQAKEWRDFYGLKAFSPIAKGFEYSHYDDFGSARSYGYSRPHLGHDMMGQIGTPIIAIESGVVEALGWNQYGGWRIGIRSFDGKRYYYYAHLRQNFPYNKSLEEGSIVTAGDVIGYMGHTGYSTEENVNNIEVVHLHWGLQLIFDESQKDSDNEIWIDCYELTKFLYRNRSEVWKEVETKEWHRVYDMKEK